MHTAQLAPLAACRAAAYAAFGRRRDALFNLCDTLLTTDPVPSLPFLSIQPQHQRKWGSLYDALAVGQISSRMLERLLVTHPLAGGEPIYAVDVSVWPRCDAPDQPRARSLLPRLTPFGRSAHRRRPAYDLRGGIRGMFRPGGRTSQPGSTIDCLTRLLTLLPIWLVAELWHPLGGASGRWNSTSRSIKQPVVKPWGALVARTVDMQPPQARRWHFSWRSIGGVGLVLMVLLFAGIFIVRQRRLAVQASAPAGVCAPTGSATGTAPLLPPGVTLPVTLPAGEPRIVATVNGDPLSAEALELRVMATLANDRQALQEAQQGPLGSLPLSLLASLERTPKQVRHDALTQVNYPIAKARGLQLRR